MRSSSAKFFHILVVVFCVVVFACACMVSLFILCVIIVIFGFYCNFLIFSRSMQTAVYDLLLARYCHRCVRLSLYDSVHCGTEGRRRGLKLESFTILFLAVHLLFTFPDTFATQCLVAKPQNTAND